MNIAFYCMIASYVSIQKAYEVNNNFLNYITNNFASNVT